MPIRRLIFGFWTVILTFAEIMIVSFAEGFVRDYVGAVIVVMCFYMFARALFPQKPQFMSGIVFLFAVVRKLLQLTPLYGFLSEKSGLLAKMAGETFDFRHLICYIIGGLICAAIDYFIIGKSKKISG